MYNTDNAFTTEDITDMLAVFGKSSVLINGSDRYSITYDWNDGNPIVNIRSREDNYEQS